MLVFEYKQVSFRSNGSLVVLPLNFNELKSNFFLRNLESVWLVNQSKMALGGRSKFQCVPGQLKMAPPIGPVLAQFLSSLAAEFISFLNGFKDMVPKSAFLGDQEFELNPVSIVLYKFKSEEFRLRLSFSALQVLFHPGSSSVVGGLWKNSFGLLFKLDNNSNVGSTSEALRVILKGILQLESYLFLVLNLYLSFCGWFVQGFFSNKSVLDYMVFNKKNYTSAFSLNINHYYGLSTSVTNFFHKDNQLFSLFTVLYRAIAFVCKGFSLQFRRFSSGNYLE
jgi:hypothetical protein